MDRLIWPLGVKECEGISHLQVRALSVRVGGAPDGERDARGVERRWIPLISAGWLPHCIGPSPSRRRRWGPRPQIAQKPRSSGVRCGNSNVFASTTRGHIRSIEALSDSDPCLSRNENAARRRSCCWCTAARSQVTKSGLASASKGPRQFPTAMHSIFLQAAAAKGSFTRSLCGTETAAGH